MGNSGVKEKSRHFSGEDAGPTMSTRAEEEYIFRTTGLTSPSDEYYSYSVSTSSYSSFAIRRNIVNFRVCNLQLSSEENFSFCHKYIALPVQMSVEHANKCCTRIAVILEWSLKRVAFQENA